MILYIPLEISVRELQGHLLLATVAVSRGHQVFIASSNDLWLFKRLNLLHKGGYLLKNVNVPVASEKIYKVFLRDGFDIYCQEQEPSILWDKFEKFLNDYNITREQMCPFKNVFCWGERDTNGYKEFFGSNRDAFVNTGSPRVDLWNPRFRSLHKHGNAWKLKPYILMVSNFGILMGNRHWSEWLIVGRNNETLQSFQQEEKLIDYILEDNTIALRMIQAIRYLSKKYQGYTIVIRPHPLDDATKWNNIVGGHENIHVASNHTSLSEWIADASLVIQNGCTSALEAVLQNVPLISFGPGRVQGDLTVPSRMGLKVETIEELDAAVKLCLSKKEYAPIQARSERILQPIISSATGDSAYKIMEIIEQNSTFSSDIKINHRGVMTMRLVRGIKNEIDWFRRSMMRKNIQQPSYRLDPITIARDVNEMAHILELPKPKLTFISSTGVLIGVL